MPRVMLAAAAALILVCAGIGARAAMRLEPHGAPDRTEACYRIDARGDVSAYRAAACPPATADAWERFRAWRAAADARIAETRADTDARIARALEQYR